MQCTELMTLYAQKGQAQLQENVQDTCTENPVYSNVCPLLLRLADYLKVSIDDIVTAEDHSHLYTTCVQGECFFFFSSALVILIFASPVSKASVCVCVFLPCSVSSLHHLCPRRVCVFFCLGHSHLYTTCVQGECVCFSALVNLISTPPVPKTSVCVFLPWSVSSLHHLCPRRVCVFLPWSVSSLHYLFKAIFFFSLFFLPCSVSSLLLFAPNKIIIKRTSRAAIYRTRWEHRALYVCTRSSCSSLRPFSLLMDKGFGRATGEGSNTR